MTLEEYLQLALRTWADRPAADRLRNATLGIAGEAGEIVEVVKKHLYHGKSHEETRVKLEGELGDLFYYAVIYMYERGWSEPAGSFYGIVRLFGKEVAPNWGCIQSSIKKVEEDDLFGMAVAIAQSAGSLTTTSAHHIKTVTGGGHTIPMDARLAQMTLAELLYYAILLGAEFDLSANEIALANIAKLNARHPNGWQQPAVKNAVL